MINRDDELLSFNRNELERDESVLSEPPYVTTIVSSGLRLIGVFVDESKPPRDYKLEIVDKLVNRYFQGKIETLQGGEDLAEMSDLEYFGGACKDAGCPECEAEFNQTVFGFDINDHFDFDAVTICSEDHQVDKPTPSMLQSHKEPQVLVESRSKSVKSTTHKPFHFK